MSSFNSYSSDVEQVDPELADALKKAKLQEQPGTSDEVLSLKPSGAPETKTDAGMSLFLYLLTSLLL